MNDENIKRYVEAMEEVKFRNDSIKNRFMNVQPYRYIQLYK